jgi:hypothetical protein
MALTIRQFEIIEIIRILYSCKRRWVLMAIADSEDCLSARLRDGGRRLNVGTISAWSSGT